jgi:hypothetical protein
MADVRSIPLWFCGIAGALCLAPEVVSDLSALTPDAAHETRLVSIGLRSGTLVASVRWAFNEETAADVLRGRISFSPDAAQCSSCSDIRFIQVARIERNGGTEYEWRGMEENRNLIRTASQARDGILDGYFVDHKASMCAPRGACSPYFRDYWANPRESGDGFRVLGSSASASLVDYPFGWDVMQRIALESCARCVETGEFLGCAQWCAQWLPRGPRTILTIHIRERPFTNVPRRITQVRGVLQSEPLAPAQRHCLVKSDTRERLCG